MSTRTKPPPEEPDEGAGAHAPAGGEASPAPRPRRPRGRATTKRGARPAAPEAGTQPGADGEVEEDRPSEPEVLWDKDQPEPVDEEESASEEAGPVVDVGSMPTLPSLAAMPASSATSVPALRGKSEGVRPSSPLEAFLNQIGRYPLLSPDEERTLTMAYYERKDPVAARKLVVHNLRLVVKMAYKYRRAWANVLDLIQEGNVGLVEAVQRFDPFKGAKFSTYATFWIRAYMLRYLLEHSRTVRISRTRVGRKLFFQLARERAKLRAQGIEPGPRLLAERLGVDQGELEEVVRHMDQPELRLDAPVHVEDQSSGTYLDGLTHEQSTPEAAAYRREFEDSVADALDSFAATLHDEREKAAWAEHLMAEDPISLSDLGERFGVTKQRMGQIVMALRKRLKTHLIERLGPDVELGYQFDAD